MLSKKVRYCHHNCLISGSTQFSRMHGIAIAYEAQYSYDHMQATLDSIGLNDVRPKDLFEVVESYIGEGYAMTTQEALGNTPDLPLL